MSGGSHRVRIRLALWSTAIVAVVLAAFSIGVYAVALRTLDAQGLALAQTAMRRVDALVLDELGDGADVDELAKELRDESDVPLYAVLVPGNDLIATERWKNARELADVLGAASDPRAFATIDDRVVRLSTGETLRVSAHRVLIGERPVVIAAAADVTDLARGVTSFAQILFGAFPVALAIALAGGWWLAGRLLAPVGALAASAERITADRLSDRLPVRHESDEFDRLAASFNRVLARVEDAFTRLQRFTADASHELRTPLTAIRMVGEVALQDAGNPQHAREAIGSMLEEIDRLATLVDGLLTLTRADAGAYRARTETVDLATLARAVVDALQPIAEDRGLTLAFDARAPVFARVDAATLRQAVSNLVDNALRYTSRGARVDVHCEIRNGASVIEVRDTGPGIAPENHGRVFERFDRLDPARASGDDGTLRRGFGLGLAIAKWAVELNHGRIELDSALGQGSTFRIALPNIEHLA